MGGFLVKLLKSLAFIGILTPNVGFSDCDIKVSTHVEPMFLSQIQCLRIASDVLWAKKFKNKSDHSEISAWGGKGKYKAVIRCVAEERVAFFVVAGLKGKLTRQYVDELGILFNSEANQNMEH